MKAEIKAIEDVYNAKVKKSARARHSTMGRSVQDDRGRRAQDANAALKKVGGGEQDEAESLLKKAQAGDADALGRLQEILPEGSTVREIARMASPEAQDATRAARRDVAEQEQAAVKRAQAAAERERQKTKEAAEDKALQDRVKAAEHHDRQATRAVEDSEKAQLGKDQAEANAFFGGGPPLFGAVLKGHGDPAAFPARSSCDVCDAGRTARQGRGTAATGRRTRRCESRRTDTGANEVPSRASGSGQPADRRHGHDRVQSGQAHPSPA